MLELKAHLTKEDLASLDDLALLAAKAWVAGHDVVMKFHCRKEVATEKGEVSGDEAVLGKTVAGGEVQAE